MNTKINAIAAISNLAQANKKFRSPQLTNRVELAVEACVALDLTPSEAGNLAYSVMEFLNTDVELIEKGVRGRQTQKV